MQQKTKNDLEEDSKQIGWYKESVDNFVCLKCWGENSRNSGYEKIFKKDLEDYTYTCDECGKVFEYREPKEIKEKIKTINDTETSIKAKSKWWKFYLLPSGTSKQIAKKGLIIGLVGGFWGVLLKGSLIGDIFDIITAYGELLLLSALVIWIKNKIKQHKTKSIYERKN